MPPKIQPRSSKNNVILKPKDKYLRGECRLEAGGHEPGQINY